MCLKSIISHTINGTIIPFKSGSWVGLFRAAPIHQHINLQISCLIVGDYLATWQHGKQYAVSYFHKVQLFFFLLFIIFYVKFPVLVEKIINK